MIILGIDPGTAICGYGLIEYQKGQNILRDYGSIKTKAECPMPQRLQRIFGGINQLLAAYQPQVVAVEKLYFNRNITTAIPVGQARGVILLACAEQDIMVAEYTPLQVKQAVSGYGRASKQQMQAMVKRILQMQHIPKPDDAADALAIAITHSRFMTNQMLVANKLGGRG